MSSVRREETLAYRRRGLGLGLKARVPVREDGEYSHPERLSSRPGAPEMRLLSLSPMQGGIRGRSMHTLPINFDIAEPPMKA